MSLTRRSVLKAAALGAVSTVVSPLSPLATAQAVDDDKQFHGLRVGVASYSLRSFPADQALQDVKRLGVRYLSLKEMHLPLSSTAEQRQQLRQQAESLGLKITSCGVIYLTNDESQMRQAFDYVRD